MNNPGDDKFIDFIAGILSLRVYGENNPFLLKIKKRDFL